MSKVARYIACVLCAFLMLIAVTATIVSIFLPMWEYSEYLDGSQLHEHGLVMHCEAEPIVCTEKSVWWTRCYGKRTCQWKSYAMTKEPGNTPLENMEIDEKHNIRLNDRIVLGLLICTVGFGLISFMCTLLVCVGQYQAPIRWTWVLTAFLAVVTQTAAVITYYAHAFEYENRWAESKSLDHPLHLWLAYYISACAIPLYILCFLASIITVNLVTWTPERGQFVRNQITRLSNSFRSSTHRRPIARSRYRTPESKRSHDAEIEPLDFENEHVSKPMSRRERAVDDKPNSSKQSSQNSPSAPSNVYHQPPVPMRSQQPVETTTPLTPIQRQSMQQVDVFEPPRTTGTPITPYQQYERPQSYRPPPLTLVPDQPTTPVSPVYKTTVYSPKGILPDSRMNETTALVVERRESYDLVRSTGV